LLYCRAYITADIESQVNPSKLQGQQGGVRSDWQNQFDLASARLLSRSCHNLHLLIYWFSKHQIITLSSRRLEPLQSNLREKKRLRYVYYNVEFPTSGAIIYLSAVYKPPGFSSNPSTRSQTSLESLLYPTQNKQVVWQGLDIEK